MENEKIPCKFGVFETCKRVRDEDVRRFYRIKICGPCISSEILKELRRR